MGLFRSAWTNDSKPDKAANAVAHIKNSTKLLRIAFDKRCSIAALEQIAQGNSDYSIRGIALDRISDKAVLTRIAETDPCWNMRAAAYKKLGLISEAKILIALNGYPYDKIEAIRSGKISQDVLFRIYREDDNAEVRDEAGRCLTRESASGATEWIAQVDEAALQKMIYYCFEYKSQYACTLIQHIYRSGRFTEQIGQLKGRVIRGESHNDVESSYQDLGDHVDYGHSDSMIPPKIFTLE